MTFRMLLLIVLGFQTTKTAAFQPFQIAMPGASGRAARTLTVVDEYFAEQDDSEPSQSHASRKHSKPEGQTQTLTGIVEWEYKPLAWDCDAPNCDHFALYDDATHANYELDDARAALPFEGKRAKVKGVVNTKDGVIHVLSIEPAK